VNGEEFASWLRRERRRAGLTQARLAEMLLVGKNTVSRWETGAQEPPATRRKAIERILSDTPEVAEPKAPYGDTSTLVRLSPEELQIVRIYRRLMGPGDKSA